MAGRTKKTTTAPAEEKAPAEETVETIEVKEKVLETADKRDLEIEELKRQLAEQQKMFADMQEMLKQAQSAPQVVQVAPQETEKVHCLFEAEVADDNIYSIGENGRYGRIIGKTGSFFVPKAELSSVMDSSSVRFRLSESSFIPLMLTAPFVSISTL